MAEDVTGAGGAVLLSSPVRRLVYRGENDWLVEHETPSGPATLEATDVISTIPLTHLVRMVSPACDPATAEAARALRFRDLITVTVMVKRPQVTTDTWLYVHDRGLIFARLHEPKNWSPDLVPGPEYSSVVCECFCTKDDATWSLPDEEISRRVVEDLSKSLGFIRAEEVVDTCVVRTRFAYPVYDLEYRDRVDTIYGFLGKHRGLHIVGRGGTFRYNNADHSIEMGQLLAKKLLGDATDHMSVNTSAEYHEEIRRTQRSVQ
jgi:protoporphyrinogen oxidase